VRNRNTNIVLRGTSVFLIILAVVITIMAMAGYSRQRNDYPPGMTIAGVPVGGLDPQQASQRVLEVYTTPVEIQYAGASIQIEPALVGFELELDSMLAAADLTRTGGSFWGGFWDYLWNRDPAAVAIPLRDNISEERLRAYLETEIASRYDTPPTPAQPIPGSTNFLPGEAGQTLDIDRAVVLLEDALRSPTERTVALSFNRTTAARPTVDNLEILLKQIIAKSGFDGVIGLFMQDLQTGQAIHFGLDHGQPISVTPDIAFTASSTIKVPIMLSYYLNRGRPSDSAASLLTEVFEKSDNVAADGVMQLLDEENGPLIVTKDMETIGLDSTYISGYFYVGAANLLPGHRTPANGRADVTTQPDSYNQTTPSDIGTLLVDLYACAQSNGGALIAAFPDKLNKDLCQEMIDYMVLDKFGSLIQAGVPDGTLVAHKHGFVHDELGIVHDISDGAIVYTPGGNFVLTVYTYHPVQAVWDVINPLIVDLTQAAYNFYNLPGQ
jgi:beta-lactamase class A